MSVVGRPAFGLVVALLATFTSCSPAASAPQVPTTSPTKASTPLPAPSAPSSPESSASPWTDFMDLAFATPSVGWAVAGRTSGGRLDVVIRRTDDGGSSWKNSAPISLASDIPVGVRFGSLNRGWLYGPGLWTSHDGGATWANTQLGGRVLAVAPAGSSLWVLQASCATAEGCPAQLIDVGPDGTGRRPLTGFPQSSTMSGLLRVTPAIAYAFDSGPDMLSSEIWVTHDAGATWAKQAVPCTPASFGVPALASLDGVVIWLACPTEPGAGAQEKSIYLSTDGGRTWALRARSFDPVEGTITKGGYIRQLVLATPAHAFLGLSRYPMLVSLDSGKTWRDAGVPNEADGGAISPWFVDSFHGWTATFGHDRHLWRTLDGGATWSELPVPTPLPE